MPGGQHRTGQLLRDRDVWSRLDEGPSCESGSSLDLVHIAGLDPVGPVPALICEVLAHCKLLSLLGLRHGSSNLHFGWQITDIFGVVKKQR